MPNYAAAHKQPSDDGVVTEKPAVAGDVLVHVRFYPNTKIASIGEKPDDLSASEWFERLLGAASPHYEVLAGGRGFFRIPRSKFDAIPKSVVNSVVISAAG